MRKFTLEEFIIEGWILFSSFIYKSKEKLSVIKSNARKSLDSLGFRSSLFKKL